MKWPGSLGLAAAAVVLLLVADVLILGVVALNRVGEPTSRLALTEREVAYPLARFGQEMEEKETDDTRLSLELRLYPGPRRSDIPTQDWLDQAKLAELGFAELPPLPVDASGSDRALQADRGLPRAAYLVLDASDEAWSKRMAAEEEALRELPASGTESEAEESIPNRDRDLEVETRWLSLLQVMGSRLFCVDAGLDAKVLRRKYSDRERFAVVRGSVKRWVEFADDGSVERVTGTCGPFEFERPLNVPSSLRPALEGVAPRESIRTLLWKSLGEEDAEIEVLPPRYEAVVAFGQRYEPWLVEIRPLGPAGGGSAGE